jgi:hypothetical protein
VVAAPVAAREACAALAGEVDDAVYLVVPEPFGAVGSWYQDFHPVGDDEVRELLAAASDVGGLPPRESGNPSGMADADLIGSEDVAFHLDLTAVEMKVTHTALRALRDDLGHEEADVRAIVQRVLDKLPGDHDMRAIRLP